MDLEQRFQKIYKRFFEATKEVKTFRVKLLNIQYSVIVNV